MSAEGPGQHVEAEVAAGFAPLVVPLGCAPGMKTIADALEMCDRWWRVSRTSGDVATSRSCEESVDGLFVS